MEVHRTHLLCVVERRDYKEIGVIYLMDILHSGAVSNIEDREEQTWVE